MSATTKISCELKLAIFAGCMISFISFGFSASFSVFLRPMSIELGWGREVFSLSLAIQALMWGITQPLAGMYADKHGSSRVLAFGAVVAALGFALRGVFDDPTLFILTGFIVGVGTGACSFPVVIVALSKIVQPAQRSFIMGLGTAAASAGMFAGAPATWLQEYRRDRLISRLEVILTAIDRFFDYQMTSAADIPNLTKKRLRQLKIQQLAGKLKGKLNPQ